MGDHEIDTDKKKGHRARQSGVKADKKKKKATAHVKETEQTARQRNPKAFAIQSVVRAERQFRRKEDLTAKKQHVPLVDKTLVDAPPPIIIAVVGPPKVGKTTLINNLIRSFTKTNVTNIQGPITVVTSKKRRITLIECSNDVSCMIDIAKCADLVLLMCDASFGFEMEIFEFLNICQVHGMPKIMGVLTHLDVIKNAKLLKRRKKELKHRFWTEVYDGAKLFYLSGILHGEYLRNEITNLGRFIAVMKFRPLTWRGNHSYVLADRMEDVTSQEQIRLNPKCDREVILYGYVHGVPLSKETMVHIAGLGDMKMHELSSLSDPCPMPSAEKKRHLLDKERMLYAPMSGVGGIVYDKDAVYIELGGSHSHNKKDMNDEELERDEIVKEIIGKKETVDQQLDEQEFQLFSNSRAIKSHEFKDTDKAEDEANYSDDSDDDDDDSGLDEEDSDDETPSGWTATNSDDDNDEEGDDDSSDEEYQDVSRRPSQGECSEDDSDDETAVMKANMSWRDNLAERARDSYLESQANSKNLMKLVYGAFGKSSNFRETQSDEEEDDEEIGGMFKSVSRNQTALQRERMILNADECCFFDQIENDCGVDWLHEDNKERLKNCFVTGKWKESEDAEELLKLDDMSDDDEELFGDFEDLETGTKVAAGDARTEQPDSDVDQDEDENPSKKRKMTRVEEGNLTKAELLAKKMKLKAKFDSEYDGKGPGEDDGRIKGDHDYYESLKAEAQRQTDINRTEFSSLDDNLRLQIEGFRAGLYVRVGFQKMPCEFVDNFDPSFPILIGGLNMAEENIGYVNCKVKKHRWYKKILKAGDPLIISLGWRRFQTVPIYAKIEDDLKQRFLKYTPNHVTCSMTFWGPITPQNTGFLALQSVKQDASEMKRLGFRIAATGCVTEMDKTTQIRKKLKLVGTPFKIYKKSAFVKGMFNSTLEVAKFEGAKIKTVSGIRGQIKKSHNKPEGSFRATFEDKILLSDIVFCRTWFKVDVPRFYTPVTSLLLPIEEKSLWQGMKTLGQLKRENNIKNQVNEDSLYKDIKRKEKVFKPLVIPKALQKALPYKDKPKHGPKDPKRPLEAGRIAVVNSPHEQKVAKMMKMVKTNFEAKKAKDKEATVKRVAKFREEKQAIELRKLKRQKELKKRVMRTISKMEKAKEAKGGQ